MTKFKDHCSGHAVEYAKFRPHYPDELFEDLALISPRHELAWDCATGNGQAAAGLARHFDRVIEPMPARSKLRARSQTTGSATGSRRRKRAGSIPLQRT